MKTPPSRALSSPLHSSLNAARSFNPFSVLPPATKGYWLHNDLSGYQQDSAGTTPGVADAPCGRWVDKSGQGFHFTQTAGTKPTLKFDAAGGFYYLNFNGTDGFLTNAAAGFTAGPMTIIAVVRQASGTGDVWGNKNGNTGFRQIMNAAGNDSGMSVGNATAFTSATVALAAATWGVIAGQYQGTGLTAYLNNVAGTPATATLSAGSAGASIGKAHDFAGSFLNGDVAALMAVNAMLSPQQLAYFSSFLGRSVRLNF